MRDLASAEQRRQKLKQQLNISLKNTSQFIFKEKEIKNKNCENLIGATQIPLGIAGPLSISHQSPHPKDGRPLDKITNYYLPLATTEGALVASVNRGCKAISQSGAVKVFVKDNGCTRAPVFKVKNLKQGKELIKWVTKNFKSIKKTSEKTNQYLQLLKIQPYQAGKNVYLRFFYKTSQAMGMNMATIATQKAVLLIEQRTKAECVSLTGNMCVDKKPNWLNFIEPRGKSAWAEAIIKKSIVQKILKTKPEKVVQVVKYKCMAGSMLSGSLGFNAHFANIIAALFLATGQDPAHVVEGSMGITTAEVEKNGNLYFSIYLPSLMLGTIGGGTTLPTQKEALSILGIKNGQKGSAIKLAQITAAAVLAGELSLISALSVGQLATAHQKLGQGKND